MSTATTAALDKKKKERSTAYPFISLQQAIKRTKELYDTERRVPAAVIVAVKAWGYAEKSSGGLQTVAALKSFGLIEDTGAGADRRIKVSDLGYRIVIDERKDSKEREELIRMAALKPKIHSVLWKQYGVELPSEENLRHILLTEHKFYENAVSDFIREYKDTITFAKLSESDTVGLEGTDASQSYKAKVGDFVQWESGGMLQFPEPKRITGFNEDGEYAFVDGSSTGIRVSELLPEKAPVGFPRPAAPEHKIAASSQNHMKEDVFSLADGRVVIQWPARLSAESIEDIKAWLEIVQRKIARSVSTDQKTE